MRPGQMPQQPGRMQQSRPVTEATQNVQAAFGNASQVLQSQPLPGQANAPTRQPAASMPEAPVQPETPSRRELKRMEKEAKKTAEAQPEGPAVVQSTVEEPDVNVDMIDL